MNKFNRKHRVVATVSMTGLLVFGFAMVASPASADIVPGSNPASNFDVNNPAPITDICKDSVLQPHTGFQIAPACVATEFGEVSAASKNPALLIVDAPDSIKSGDTFDIKFSSKNLIRDRFLAAATGGYYAEGAVLDPVSGLTHGHAHVACRVLPSKTVAGNPDGVPAFFKAVEDNKGGAVADTVIVTVPGKNAAGGATFPKGTNVQCSVWAGDGSHRVPMMQRANETPAFDSVRISVGDGDLTDNVNDGRRDGRNDDSH